MSNGTVIGFLFCSIAQIDMRVNLRSCLNIHIYICIFVINYGCVSGRKDTFTPGKAKVIQLAVNIKMILKKCSCIIEFI